MADNEEAALAMNKLRIALVHANRPRDFVPGRMVGIWSYDVPEFEIRHFGTPRQFRMKRSDFRLFDVIVREDHKCYGQFINDYDIPVVAYIVDSTLSDDHYQTRLKLARTADLVLVEQDDLARFAACRRVRRLPYCVNENLYKDYGLPKSVDVGMYCNDTPQRVALGEKLRAFCEQQGYSFEYGRREGTEYAKAFNAAKVCVNLARTPTNRPHRTFDVMACKSCLLTSSLPDISGEERENGVHYATFYDDGGAALAIGVMLESGEWQDVAQAGYDLVREKHTWAVRAKELRQIFYEELGL